LFEAAQPERRIPMTMTAGSRDDRLLALTGLTELPLDPVEILTQPVMDQAIERHLATLGLDPARYGALARAHATELRWPGTDPAFRFLVLDGVRHRYPNGRNNPAGFAVAPEFWEFFTAHPLPLSQAAAPPRQ
jgi:hypothetical protein